MQHLTIENLSFERNDLPVFSQLAASWPEASLVQVLGQNGAGKTTLLRLIAGILMPSTGEITWRGHNMMSYEAQRNLLYLGHEVGVDYSLSARENLHWYFDLHGHKGVEGEKAADKHFDPDALLAQLGMKGYGDTLCQHMSAGQRRRVALARLFISEARLWVLDEPFTSIDKEGVEALSSCIQQHVDSGGLVILSSHQAWPGDQVRYLDLAQYKAGFSWQ